MIHVIIAIKDNAVQAFQPLFNVRSEGEAIRNFMDVINDVNNRQLNKHPSDFDLYILGYFNDDTGQLEATPLPKLLVRGLDVINK